MTLLTESLSGSSGHFTQFNESWKRCGRFGSSLPSDKPRWSRTSWPPVAAALSTLRGCIYRALQMSHLAGCPLFVHQIYRSPTLGRAPWFTTRTLPLHRHQLPPLWLLQMHHLAFSLLTGFHSDAFHCTSCVWKLLLLLLSQMHTQWKSLLGDRQPRSPCRADGRCDIWSFLRSCTRWRKVSGQSRKVVRAAL